MFQMGKALVTDSYFMTIYFGIDLHMNILYQFLRLLNNKWSFFSGELNLDGILLNSFSFLAITNLEKLFSNFPAVITWFHPFEVIVETKYNCAE